MIPPRLFLCSGAELSERDSLADGRKIVPVDSIGPSANVNVRLENVARVFNQHLSPRLVDLLEIAAYIFAADCSTNRGEEWSDEQTTEPWGRDFSFVVPVRDITFWSRDDVQALLTEILSFLSDDTYKFTFRSLARDRQQQDYLVFGEIEDWPFYGVDRVLMFSGGLDSLAGAVETAQGGCKMVLVSHRSVTTMDSRQRRLFHELNRQYPNQMVHIPVWINEERRLGRESTQRTRSFLYSALGTVVAESIQAGGVRFFENGIISINLPVADEVLRARASRTTHPKVLDLFNRFYRLATGRPFVIDNPYLFSTKADVAASIAKKGAAHLIQYTCSCAYPMFKSKSQWHCGACSQCIDRRFAILAAGLSAYDSETDYVCDVFTGPRKDGQEKNMAVDYIRHGVELHRMSELELAARFNAELSRAVRFEKNPSAAAQRLVAMHKQHGDNLVRVLQQQIGQHSGELLTCGLDQSSLLSMAVGGKHLEPSWGQFCDRISELLQAGVPVICQKNKPKDEPHFQEVCDGILKATEAKLVREYPFMRWSSTLTKPDWSHEALRVFVEAKYVRKKRDVHAISEAVASDITKYGDNERRVLFIVYDPFHVITDEQEFSAPITGRPNMRVALIR